MMPRPDWQAALYGDDGFYRRYAPSAHFATAAQGRLGGLLAQGLIRYAWASDLADSAGVDVVVDFAAGRGELAIAFRALLPDAVVIAVDIGERPTDLPTSIGWLRSPGGAAVPTPEELAATVTTSAEGQQIRRVLVVANEWLDVVPCAIVTVREDGALTVGEAERAWLEQWVPRPWLSGERFEVGLSRDQAYAALVTSASQAAALLGDLQPEVTVIAIDYGHTREDRPRHGTLMGYRDGVACEPAFDGSCDITAHVAMDSLGAQQLCHQREALAGLPAGLPDRALASSDPPAYLRRLSAASELAELRATGGYGDFWWAVTRAHAAS